MRSRAAKRRTFSLEQLERRAVPSALSPGMDVVASRVVHARVHYHHDPPSLFASTISAGEIDPTWTAVEGAAGYQFQRRPAGTTDWYPDNPAGIQVSTSALTYRDTGLAAGTRYEYRVRATNKAGKPLTDWSATAAAITYRPTPMLSATPVSPTEIDLSWTAVPGATRYEVQYQQPGMAFWYEDVAVGVTTYRSTVPAGTTWDYRVRATDAAHDPITDWSEVASATTTAS